MSWSLIVHQLAVGPDKQPQPHRWLPPGDRQRGVICQGSATESVNAWLEAKHPIAYWTRQQIVLGTGRPQKAVDWALIFLRTTGRVEACQDTRNPRYLRYRLVRSTK
jgi:hypothetical protein